MSDRNVGFGFLSAKTLPQALTKARHGDRLILAPGLPQDGSPLSIDQGVILCSATTEASTVLKHPVHVGSQGHLVLEDLHLHAPISVAGGGRLLIRRCHLRFNGNLIELQAGAMLQLEAADGHGVLRAHGAEALPVQMRWLNTRWQGVEDLGVLMSHTVWEAASCTMDQTLIMADGYSELQLSQCLIKEAPGDAMLLQHKSTARLDRVVFQSGTGAHVLLEDDASLYAENLRCEHAGRGALCARHQSAVQLHGAYFSGGDPRYATASLHQQARLLAHDMTIDQAPLNALWVRDLATVEAHRAHIAGAGRSAVQAEGQARVQLIDSTLAGGGDWGLVALDTARVDMRGGRLAVHREGRMRQAPEAVLTLEDVVLRDEAALAQARQDLAALVGLDSVKAEVDKLIDLVEAERRRAQAGVSGQTIGLHLVFTGNPGTGKTTVARLIGRIFSALGLLKSGHLIETDRSDLVGEHIGETAPKTRRVLQRARDGVLFIDEAYALHVAESPRDFGQEAIATLIKDMEDNRGRLSVIVAGYNQEMAALLDANPGFRSRFNRYIHFPDYSAQELLEVFRRQCEARHLRASDEVFQRVEQVMVRLVHQGARDFGNARTVRSYLDKVVEQQAGRLRDDPQADPLCITEADLPRQGRQGELNVDELAARLQGLYGLEQVKAEVLRLRNLATVQERRMLAGLAWTPLSMHQVFLGEPGCGQGTVARLLGQLYASMGLLERGHVHEVHRADLVAGHVGQTAQRTRQHLEEASGGVLLVREADTLLNELDHGFGAEAMEALLQEMRNPKQRMAVVLTLTSSSWAHLNKQHARMMELWPAPLIFEPPDPATLARIFCDIANCHHYTVDAAGQAHLVSALALRTPAQRSAWRHSHGMTELFHAAVSAQAERLCLEPNALLDRLTPEDLNRAWVRLDERTTRS